MLMRYADFLIIVVLVAKNIMNLIHYIRLHMGSKTIIIKRFGLEEKSLVYFLNMIL
jgi:hypothetical protein